MIWIGSGKGESKNINKRSNAINRSYKIYDSKWKIEVYRYSRMIMKSVKQGSKYSSNKYKCRKWVKK